MCRHTTFCDQSGLLILWAATGPGSLSAPDTSDLHRQPSGSPEMVYVCFCVCLFLCVCVWVLFGFVRHCARTPSISVCLCVCVCEREKKPVCFLASSFTLGTDVFCSFQGAGWPSLLTLSMP